MKLKKELLLIFIIIFSNNLFGQEKIFGLYTSNVAELGFFVTKIRLNKDSTFEYGFSGDLIHQTGKGIFEINNKNEILLKFEKNNEKEKTVEELLSSGNSKLENKKYKYQNGKLFAFHLDGYVVKRGQAYSRHKKYLFWGERYLTKRKIYLKKPMSNTAYMLLLYKFLTPNFRCFYKVQLLTEDLVLQNPLLFIYKNVGNNKRIHHK